MFNPLSNKDALRRALLRLREDPELYDLIKAYVREVLGQRIIGSPSKGPYGEQGKDIVTVENEDDLDYCCYVMKRGSLQANLDGPYGILKQMRDAMLKPLEQPEYGGKRRTVVVVHNGDEGYRGAIDRFEKARQELEKEVGSLLLRPIERWDNEELTKRVFENREYFMESMVFRGIQERYYAHEELNLTFHSKVEVMLSERGAKDGAYKKLVMEHFERIRSIEQDRTFLKRYFKIDVDEEEVNNDQ